MVNNSGVAFSLLFSIYRYTLPLAEFLDRQYVDCSRWCTITNTRFAPLILTFVTFTQNVAQDLLHHVTYAPANFEIVMSDRLGLRRRCIDKTIPKYIS